MNKSRLAQALDDDATVLRAGAVVAALGAAVSVYAVVTDPIKNSRVFSEPAGKGTVSVWLEADRDSLSVVAVGEIDAGVDTDVSFSVGADGQPQTSTTVVDREDHLRAVELVIENWEGYKLSQSVAPLAPSSEKTHSVQFRSEPIDCRDLPENVTISFTASYDNGKKLATSVSPLVGVHELCGLDQLAQQAPVKYPASPVDFGL